MLRRARSSPWRRFGPRPRLHHAREARVPDDRRLRVAVQQLDERRRGRRLVHSPAWYDSPSPIVAARREAADQSACRSTISIVSGRPLPKRPHASRPGARRRACPPSQVASAPVRMRTAIALEHASARGRDLAERALDGAHSFTEPDARDERRLVVERHALRPELDGLPVDQRGHLHRHQRVADERSGARLAFVSSCRSPVEHGASAARGRPRARARAPRPRPPAPRTRTRTPGRARRTARRAGACRGRRCRSGPRRSSGSRSPNVLFSSAIIAGELPVRPVAPVEA